MSALLAALAGALIAAGLVAMAYGLQRRPEAPPKPKVARPRVIRTWVAIDRRLRIATAAALAAGIAVAVGTGWLLAAVVFPVAVLGLPYVLVHTSDKASIERLDAMAEWTRNLAGVLTAGVGLEQALIVSRRSTPAAIEPEVARLVARLDARWTVQDALQGFAADLNDATGDLMVMMLLMGAESRGGGLATVLQGVAESTAADVAARRAIEADRAKPRATARWVTILSAGAMVVFALSGQFLAPYATASGQLILAALLGAYGFLLVQMRRMSQGRPMPRLLADAITTGREA